MSILKYGQPLVRGHFSPANQIAGMSYARIAPPKKIRTVRAIAIQRPKLIARFSTEKNRPPRTLILSIPFLTENTQTEASLRPLSPTGAASTQITSQSHPSPARTQHSGAPPPRRGGGRRRLHERDHRRGGALHVANVGDSRPVAGVWRDGRVAAEDLSWDQAQRPASLRGADAAVLQASGFTDAGAPVAGHGNQVRLPVQQISPSSLRLHHLLLNLLSPLSLLSQIPTLTQPPHIPTPTAATLPPTSSLPSLSFSLRAGLIKLFTSH
jgi:hypothetical protein